MSTIINYLLLAALVVALLYVWWGVSGRGWTLPSLSEILGPGGTPETVKFGNKLGCKWSGSC